jgi:tetratricopeptide (TPR) repeat protein
LGLGKIAYAQQEYAQAREFFEESLTLFQEFKSALTIGNLNNFLGDVALTVGDYPEAGNRYRQAIATYQDIGVLWARSLTGDRWGVARSLNELGAVALAMGDACQARVHYRQALEIAVDQNDLDWSLEVLVSLASALAEGEDKPQAVELAVLVLHHTASTEKAREQSKRLLDRLEAELASGAFVAAQERGQTLDLETALTELLAAGTQSAVGQQSASEPARGYEPALLSASGR